VSVLVHQALRFRVGVLKHRCSPPRAKCPRIPVYVVAFSYVYRKEDVVKTVVLLCFTATVGRCVCDVKAAHGVAALRGMR
jgi:hypothetical protein